MIIVQLSRQNISNEEKWKFFVSKLQTDTNQIEKELRELDFEELHDGDPDNTWLTRYILFYLCRNHVDELQNVDQIGIGKDYRGDTMNSFNTLFRWWLDEQDDEKNPTRKKNKQYARKRLQSVLGREKYLDFYAKINHFHHTYHKIGNFILLPNKTVNRTRLNNARGFNRELQDFFDLFLIQLKSKMETGKSTQLECFFDDCFYEKYFHSSRLAGNAQFFF